MSASVYMLTCYRSVANRLRIETSTEDGTIELWLRDDDHTVMLELSRGEARDLMARIALAMEALREAA